MARATYADNLYHSGLYEVTFMVNKTRTKLTKTFDSEYLARVFTNKIRWSKKCTLISYPDFVY